MIPNQQNGCYTFVCRYLVTHLMGADLNNIVRTQKLTDEHVQFLVYQILRGLKVSNFRVMRKLSAIGIYCLNSNPFYTS